MAPLLEIEGLVKRYGRVVAVDDVGLTVEAGEVVGLLGPNGAGKTTTVACAVGLARPDSGTVRTFGSDPWTDDTVRERIGVQLQAATLQDRLRVDEALALFASAYREPIDWKALRDEWGLGHRGRTPFSGLSGGERQRLFVVLALLGRPELVVLDELTTGLDVEARRATWDLVRRLPREGAGVLLVSHAMDEVAALCDRVVVVAAGRVVARGTPAELTAGHASLEEAYLALTSRQEVTL